MFASWGRFVYRRRWITLAVSGVLLALSAIGILAGGTLVGNGGFGATLPAGQASKLINDEMKPQSSGSTGSQITLIFSSPTLLATSDEFRAALEQALAPLQVDPRVTSVTRRRSRFRRSTAFA